MSAPAAASSSPERDTPLLRQYSELKAAYPEAVLFFRLGDFYEMFGEDAKLASPLLGLVLTARQGLPMCGVPAHSHEGYVAKLLKAGHKVAIAEQMEPPSKGKKLVERQVVRLVTPGTIVEEELLDPSAASRLASLELDVVGWGLAVLDLSTGEFWATQALNDSGFQRLSEALARLRPSEILASADAAELPDLSGLPGACLTRLPAAPARSAHLPAWAKDVAWTNRPLALKAALRARLYAQRAQLQINDSLLSPSFREPGGTLELDESAVRTLELVESSSGGKAGSLWGHLDLSSTSMGGRRLKSWLLEPSTDLQEITRRLNSVDELVLKPELRADLRERLSRAADIPRIAGRLLARRSGPRDLAALRQTLDEIPEILRLLRAPALGPEISEIARALVDAFSGLSGLHDSLLSALSDAPPAKLSDGGVIRRGFSRELDELRRLRTDGQTLLAEMAASERKKSGIATLKAGYNSVFGYFFEVTKTHQAKVPAYFLRKQTLAGAERYITPELKELESRMLSAEEKIVFVEAELFADLREKACASYAGLLKLAGVLSDLDGFAALAQAAALHGFVKPVVDLSHDLAVTDGRHPVVEASLPAGRFVPNSLSLSSAGERVMVLTGPNMGGKSTYLRQNAIIALMAQAGSFVPASAARIGLVDKIMTRIGAQDMLARGESTFMVEMKETARILARATPRSLLVLDEIGRGTSTFDGVSIAWAVLEHLHGAYGPGEAGASPDVPLGPRTLFATHYFELTELAKNLAGVVNCNVEVKEWTDARGKNEVVFLHKISPGPADRSYGLHVAALAGLPGRVLSRAEEILAELENASAVGRVAQAPARELPELPIFEGHPVLRSLRLLDPESMTPLDAHRILVELQKALQG